MALSAHLCAGARRRRRRRCRTPRKRTSRGCLPPSFVAFREPNVQKSCKIARDTQQHELVGCAYCWGYSLFATVFLLGICLPKAGLPLPVVVLQTWTLFYTTGLRLNVMTRVELLLAGCVSLFRAFLLCMTLGREHLGRHTFFC